MNTCLNEFKQRASQGEVYRGVITDVHFKCKFQGSVYRSFFISTACREPRYLYFSEFPIEISDTR